jgi:hypothetical protein
MGQLDGHCLCGKVTYSCDGEPMATLLCHCTDCQRQTGTAFSIVVGVERDALAITGATLKSFTTVGEDTKQEVERQFCSACGSPIVSLPAATPDLAFIKAGTLNDRSWLEPEMEMWARSAHPYVTFDEEARGVFARSVPFD